MERSTIFNGKIHYFYGNFQQQTVSLPEGMSKIIDASTCILYMTGLCWTMGGLRGCTRQGFASKSVGNGKSQCPIGKFIYIYLYTYIKKNIYIILYIYTYYVCVCACVNGPLAMSTFPGRQVIPEAERAPSDWSVACRVPMGPWCTELVTELGIIPVI